MAQIPQPAYTVWSPDTAPLDDPEWQGLGRVFDIVVDRDIGKPSKASLKLRNGSSIETAQHALTDWRRWAALQVRIDLDGDGGDPIFTGAVTKLDHDTADLKLASRVNIDAMDALGVFNRDSIAHDLDTYPEGFPGFATTAAGLADEINAMSDAIDTVIVVDSPRAPVTLPADIVEDSAKVKHARFNSNAYDALKRALDVELGTAHLSADGQLIINGRYSTPITANAGAAIQLTDDPAQAALGATPYMSGSLRWADPIAEYHNTASVTGLRKLEHKAGTVPAGDPVDTLPGYDGIFCNDEWWVEANAQLLAKLNGAWKVPWPTAVDVLIWDSAMSDFAFAQQLIDASNRLGRTTVYVPVTLPGKSTQLYAMLLNGLTWRITESHIIATLKLGNDLTRWQAAYDLSVGIFSLDDPDRGLDSGAILGP